MSENFSGSFAINKSEGNLKLYRNSELIEPAQKQLPEVLSVKQSANEHAGQKLTDELYEEVHPLVDAVMDALDRI
jgi:hypothetical protein